MTGSTRSFGAPMVDEYAIVAARRRRHSMRERALIRARTGLSSTVPRSTIYADPGRRLWRALLWWRRG